MKYHHFGPHSFSLAMHLPRPSLRIACSPTLERNCLHRVHRSSRSLSSWDFAALAGLVEGVRSSPLLAPGELGTLTSFCYFNRVLLGPQVRHTSGDLPKLTAEFSSLADLSSINIS